MDGRTVTALPWLAGCRPVLALPLAGKSAFGDFASDMLGLLQSEGFIQPSKPSQPVESLRLFQPFTEVYTERAIGACRICRAHGEVIVFVKMLLAIAVLEAGRWTVPSDLPLLAKIKLSRSAIVTAITETLSALRS